MPPTIYEYKLYRAHYVANVDCPRYLPVFIPESDVSCVLPDDTSVAQNYSGMVKKMKVVLVILLALLAGCTRVSDEELKAKVNACTAAGMDYSYLNDFRGKPYDVMCVARRLH